MREISCETISRAVAGMISTAAFELPSDVLEALAEARRREVSENGRLLLGRIEENARLARECRLPLCQDTGTAVFFVEVGAGLRIVGGLLTDAINDGVREGYGRAFLRKSICHPFTRANTGDNTPAIIHFIPVAGDRLHMTYLAKGGGAENKSAVRMLKPSDGKRGVIEAVLDIVGSAGASPCPPVVTGVGIGGNLERAAWLAKYALRRPLNRHNPDAELAGMEAEILERINRLGIGPLGLGGSTSCLGVHIELESCHIASLPLAVNLNCHSDRRGEVEL